MCIWSSKKISCSRSQSTHCVAPTECGRECELNTENVSHWQTANSKGTKFMHPRGKFSCQCGNTLQRQHNGNKSWQRLIQENVYLPLHYIKTFPVVTGSDFCVIFPPQLCGCRSRLSHGLIAKAGSEEEWKASVSVWRVLESWGQMKCMCWQEPRGYWSSGALH